MTPAKPISVDLSFLRVRKTQQRIGAAALAFGVLGFVYGTFATKSYRSTMTVVAAGQQKQGVASLLGGQLSGLAAAFDGGGGADVARIAAVLQSTAVTDAVIEKFDLKKRYDKRFQEQVRQALWSACNVKTLTKPSLVQVTCDDQDPRFAQTMLNFFAEHGNKVFRRVSVGSASEEVRFLERRVAELRLQADEAAARMRQFQETHQMVDLDSQAKAVVSSVAMLQAQRISKQMELDYARTFSSADEPSMRQLASQLAVMDEQLRDMEETRVPPASGAKVRTAGSGAKGSGMFPVAMAVPKLRADYERLLRDRKVAEATLVFALERLEGAKAHEARDVSTFQVLDPPTLADRHSAPLRSETTLVGLVIGLLGAVAFEWRRQERAKPGA
jgi:tyrosine-protein kinase Etk/Wzc